MASEQTHLKFSDARPPGFNVMMSRSVAVPEKTPRSEIWKYFVTVRDPEVQCHAWRVKFVFTMFWAAGAYAAGLGLTVNFLGVGQWDFRDGGALIAVAFLGAVTLAWESIEWEAVAPEGLHLMQWKMLNNRDVTLSEILAILNGLQGSMIVKNLIWGPYRAKFLSVFILLAKVGPIAGLGLLYSAYEVDCPGSSAGDFYSFRVRTKLNLLIGGLVALMGSLLLTFIGIGFRKRDLVQPPRSVLAQALALSEIIGSLDDHISTTTSANIKERTNLNEVFRLQVVDRSGQAAFVFCRTPSSEQSNRIQREKTDAVNATDNPAFTKTPVSSHIIQSLPSVAFAALLACAIHITLEFFNRHSHQDYCRGSPSSSSLSGFSIPPKFLLAVLTLLYSLVLRIGFDQTMHIYRFVALNSNHVSLAALERIFAPHSLTSYWYYRGLGKRSGRAFFTGLCSTIVVRLMVVVIGPLTLTATWIPSQAHTIRYVAIGLTWGCLLLLIVLWVEAVRCAKGIRVPADDVIAMAAMLEPLVKQTAYGNVDWKRIRIVQ